MDIVTFVPNLNVFRQALSEGESPFVKVNEEDKVELLIPHTPIVYNGNKTLTLLRCNPAQLAFIESFPSIDIIAVYKGGEDYEFVKEGLPFFKSDVSARGRYAEVYSTEPYNEPNDEGGLTLITPPKMIGKFL